MAENCSHYYTAHADDLEIAYSVKVNRKLSARGFQYFLTGSVQKIYLNNICYSSSSISIYFIYY